MRNGVFLRCVLTCSLAGILLACGDDSDEGDGNAGAGGGGGGSGGSDGVKDPDPINADCPTTVGPFQGQYAMKGDCCYRRSNSARIEEFDGEDESSELVTLEYKAALFTVANHPATASNASIKGAAIDRFDKEEQALLFRFELPREGGEWKAGEARVRIGPGRYNCGDDDEGTYSFYSDTAAPETPNWTEADRWKQASLPATFDPDAEEGRQIRVNWATNSNRGLSWLPYLIAAADSNGEQPLDWETVSSGFDILSFPALEDAIDCAGERDEIVWVAGAQTISFIPIDLNNKDPIGGPLGGITLSQLLAFLPAPSMKDLPRYNPETAPRCMPGTGCDWKKLPDSLCPTTDDERENWGCHLGYEDNPDDVATHCTADAPTGALDPDEGATSEGQCCDPLGESDSLPACNAFYVVNDVVAAAIEITDEESDDLQTPCAQ